MTEARSQAAVEPEGYLASMSRWATAPAVIPLLTGFTFAASPVLGFVAIGMIEFFATREALPMAIACLILGLGLGFPLRRAMIRIRDAGRPGAGIRVVVGVGFVWILAAFVQLFFFYYMSI